MEEGINKFLAYCERTGERPEKVFIDGKTYVVEWHPNKMLKRIYQKQLDEEEIELSYITKVKHQGTTSIDNTSWKREHSLYYRR